MAELTWGSVGSRFFETGTDRGVLFLSGSDGVVWNGLIGVTEAPSGGEPAPFYQDGIKYLNLSAAEEFAATIQAYSSPSSFALCDGTKSISVGLFATQQPRASFGLSYRTRVGNDVDGTDHGYKIHIVYGCQAAPTGRDNRSTNATPTPMALSWAITTMPVLVPGAKATAHLVIDSTLTSPAVLTQVEDILYGTAITESRLPTVAELLGIFTA